MHDWQRRREGEFKGFRRTQHLDNFQLKPLPDSISGELGEEHAFAH